MIIGALCLGLLLVGNGCISDGLIGTNDAARTNVTADEQRLPDILDEDEASTTDAAADKADEGGVPTNYAESCQDGICFAHPTDWSWANANPMRLADKVKRVVLEMSCPPAFDKLSKVSGTSKDGGRDIGGGRSVTWSYRLDSGTAQILVIEKGRATCSITTNHCSNRVIDAIIASMRSQ